MKLTFNEVLLVSVTLYALFLIIIGYPPLVVFLLIIKNVLMSLFTYNLFRAYARYAPV